MDDVSVMSNPTLWPEYPYLRIDRRHEDRPGQPFCFLKAANEMTVEPVVLMGPTWPPQPDFEPDMSYRFAFESLEAVAQQGWRVFYMF